MTTALYTDRNSHSSNRNTSTNAKILLLGGSFQLQAIRSRRRERQVDVTLVADKGLGLRGSGLSCKGQGLGFKGPWLSKLRNSSWPLPKSSKLSAHTNPCDDSFTNRKPLKLQPEARKLTLDPTTTRSRPTAIGCHRSIRVQMAL